MKPLRSFWVGAVGAGLIVLIVIIARLRGGDLEAAAKEFYNSLEAPALHKYPVLALFQDFLRSQGAAVALMSGSGSTTFAIVDDWKRAETLREKFLNKFSANCWTALVPIP